LPRQPFGDQRSGDAAADDQRVAFQVFGYIDAAALLRARKPWRAAAAQVGLLGLIGFEGGNGGSVRRNGSMLMGLSPQRPVIYRVPAQSATRANEIKSHTWLIWISTHLQKRHFEIEPITWTYRVRQVSLI
jgi:hypothetical protein